MIHYIKGKISIKMETGIVVENNGIGYEIQIPDNSPLYSSKEDEEVIVYTALVVREDDMSLFGFHDKESLALFYILRTVNGVGAKVALALQSVLSSEDIMRAIGSEDTATLTRAPGIGKKTAMRMVLELKDKFKDYSGGISPEEIKISGSAKSEAINALMGLGFSRSEAISSISSVDGEDLTTEELIRQALRKPDK